MAEGGAEGSGGLFGRGFCSFEDNTDHGGWQAVFAEGPDEKMFFLRGVRLEVASGWALG